MKLKNFFVYFLLLLIAVACKTASEQDLPSVKELEASFLDPPETAKPWTWWHWVDGNVTREGITNDLEAMDRAGLAAALIFNVKLGFPDGPARFMSDHWLDLLDHTASECDRLGLKLGIHNCDGWSQAGGPWISPEQSMKKLVWSKVEVEGPSAFNGVLPKPPIPQSPLVNGFYQEVAVLAYPTPTGERTNGRETGISVSGSLESKELAKLFDEDPLSHATFSLGTYDLPEEHSISMHFSAPIKARSLVFHGLEGYSLAQVIPGKLEVSEDGKEFQKVAGFDLNWSFEGSPHHTLTIAFPEVQGKVFRIGFQAEHIFVPSLSIAEIELSTKPAVHYWEAKTGWARNREHGGEAPFLTRDPGPEASQLNLPEEGVVPVDQVRIFRGEIDEAGHFEWDVPEGKWTILRIGYTSTGRTNSPATDEGRGLEADKLDAAAVRFHMEQFLGRLTERYGEKGLESFNIFETDSWESGAQTWTKDLDKRFINSTGQDLIQWLPLLVDGVVVAGYEESNRLMWEWRRFLADEFTENYLQVTADFAAEKGLTYVAEASGRQMFMYDPIGYQRISPVPMGEFWVSKARGQGVRVDNKVASSAAHLTGRKLVASEAYTSSHPSSRWTQHPFTLKGLGDEAFCSGVNKFVFHTYAHQPYPALKPGFTMAIWGLHNHNGNTWWEGPVEAWFVYLARCQYLLQEGRFYADILAYLGEEVPARLGRRPEFKPRIPVGYDYDGCDFQALLDAEVEDGEIVLPSGMRYRILLLPAKNRMRVAVAERIAELVKAGATVISPVIPEASPSLKEMGAGDDKVVKIGKEIWTGKPGSSKGSGEIIVSKEDDLGNLLQDLDIPPDFTYDSKQAADIRFIHRVANDCDIFFLSNQQAQACSFEARFKAARGGKISLWDPSTGRKMAAEVQMEAQKGILQATLSLDPYGSVFVIISDVELALEPSLEKLSAWPVEGPWELKFPGGSGAPDETLKLKTLPDWTMHEDFGVRHFSGTASYTTNLPIDEEYLAGGKHILISLGEVREMAEILVNGQRAGLLWKPPFQLDITGLLQAGKNELEVKITNLWVNRLIGDEYFPDEMEWYSRHGNMLPVKWPDWLINGEPRPASDRVTWTTRGKIYAKDDPLLSSGLLGPVLLIVSEEGGQ